MKKLQKDIFYNNIHIWTVRGLIGLTMVGSAMLVHRTYLFFTETLPRRREEKRLLQEEQMHQEQIEREAELVRRQREAERVPF